VVGDRLGEGQLAQLQAQLDRVDDRGELVDAPQARVKLDDRATDEAVEANAGDAAEAGEGRLDRPREASELRGVEVPQLDVRQGSGRTAFRERLVSDGQRR
jgi:hypothetical protein